jgi:hypothetical protein
MWCARRRYAIAFNGEIYNFADLKRELGLDAASLRSRTDTEVLLHAWSRWGPETLDRLVGQFAFALWDRDQERLWLARDRFGEKPLFFHAGREAIVFRVHAACPDRRAFGPARARSGGTDGILDPALRGEPAHRARRLPEASPRAPALRRSRRPRDAPLVRAALPPRPRPPGAYARRQCRGVRSAPRAGVRALPGERRAGSRSS